LTITQIEETVGSPFQNHPYDGQPVQEMMRAEHERSIRQAIELAITSGKKGNHTFGAVLVHDSQVIATAENTEVSGEGYGHAEYNLAIESGRRFSERVLRECTVYTSTAPCPRCAFAILALGIPRIAFSVSPAAFAKLVPGKPDTLTMDEIIRKLGLKDVELLGPFLEDEGLRAFEYWGGEYHPLEELLEDARREKELSAAKDVLDL
jgi:tRNA(Arg) A34 adenosine deaminase TadA